MNKHLKEIKQLLLDIKKCRDLTEKDIIVALVGAYYTGQADAYGKQVKELETKRIYQVRDKLNKKL